MFSLTMHWIKVAWPSMDRPPPWEYGASNEAIQHGLWEFMTRKHVSRTSPPAWLPDMVHEVKVALPLLRIRRPPPCCAGKVCQLPNMETTANKLAGSNCVV